METGEYGGREKGEVSGDRVEGEGVKEVGVHGDEEEDGK